MQLNIKNFAKIDHAKIDIQGITVIAGSNNTGKSTIGKILYGIFNSLLDINDKIISQRSAELKSSCTAIIREYFSGHVKTDSVARNIYLRINDIVRQCVIADWNEGRIDDNRWKLIEDSSLGTVMNSEQIAELKVRFDGIMKEIMEIPENVLILEVLTRYFNKIFSNQINPLTDAQVAAELNLNIKEKDIYIKFVGNECTECTDPIYIEHKAVYIDNPFVVDSLEFFDANVMGDHLKQLLTQEKLDEDTDNVIKSVLIKEKTDAIFKILDAAVSGVISKKNRDEYCFQEDEQVEPVYFANLSTGVKAFVILRMLLEKGIIKEKDVLILDEPEIHQHPEWQVIYAEAIVLLQKHFELNIVVTTHSPYFLDAINLYSIRHGVQEKVNYYLSKNENGKVIMEDVTNNIETIYARMTTPVEMLETLRYELNCT